jgi:hypothetical protein
MPISNLTAKPGETANKHRARASLLALVKDAQGQIVERVSKDVPSEVSDNHLAAVQAELMTYQHVVGPPSGHYTVEVAVVDHEGNRPGTLVRRLESLGRAPDAAGPFEFPGNEFQLTADACSRS